MKEINDELILYIIKKLQVNRTNFFNTMKLGISNILSDKENINYKKDVLAQINFVKSVKATSEK